MLVSTRRFSVLLGLALLLGSPAPGLAQITIPREGSPVEVGVPEMSRGIQLIQNSKLIYVCVWEVCLREA